MATRAADHRAVVVAGQDRPLEELERLFPPEAVHRTIIFDDEPTDAARSRAADRGLELIGPAALGPALGELLLPSALLAGEHPGSEEESLDGPFPPAGPPGLTVRPRIGRREAQEIAGLDGARYTLRLVPYYVASYRVRTVAPNGGEGPVRRRLVAVNATSRRGEIWEEGTRELTREVDGPSERLAPQLNEAGARDIAIETVRRAHTVRVDHTEQHAGALVVESRRVPPPAEGVRLGPMSLLFVPYWYAESTDGRRVLDAVSGRGPPEADAR